MAAPKGNQFWKARSSHGRRPAFASAETLWEACTEYFEWVEKNPLWEDRLVTFQGSAAHEPVAKMRAMTIAGLCLFLDIDKETWRTYRNSKDFLAVCTRAEEVIREQKFTGAAADLLNPSIIARDLGLAERTEHAGADGKPLIPEQNPEEIARHVAFLLARAANEKDDTK